MIDLKSQASYRNTETPLGSVLLWQLATQYHHVNKVF